MAGKMKVRYLGEGDPLSLLHGKIYEVEAVDPKAGWYTIIDETHEDYAYPPDLFEIVK